MQGDPAASTILQNLASRLDLRMSMIARISAIISAVILTTMVGLILAEIVMRNVFSTSLQFAGEFVGYGLAAITFNTLAYALEKDALIRVTLLTGRVERFPLLARCLEAVSLLSALAITGLITVFFWRSVARHMERGTVSETVAQVPIWIAEGAMLLGLAIFFLRLVTSLLNLLAGNWTVAGAKAGSVWGPDAEQRGE